MIRECRARWTIRHYREIYVFYIKMTTSAESKGTQSKSGGEEKGDPPSVDRKSPEYLEELNRHGWQTTEEPPASYQHSSDLLGPRRGGLSSSFGEGKAVYNCVEDEKVMSPTQGSTQSVLISPEDMQFVIRDTSTGASYDSRDQASASLLSSQVDEQLTKLNSPESNKPWQEWWKTKRGHNMKLLSAAEKGDLTAVRDCLDEAKYKDLVADINAKGLDEFTPLHFAVSEGHGETVKLLLEMGAKIDSTSSSGRTPLHVACNRGNRQILELLVNSGANVNAQDHDGNTPSHILSEGGWQDAFEWYLGRHPDLTLKNVFNETATDVAANLSVRQLCQQHSRPCGAGDTYTRTVVENVILRTSRADTVRRLMFIGQLMGANAPADPPPSSDSTSASTSTALSASPPPVPTSPSKSKSRRIKILEATKRMGKEIPEDGKERPSVPEKKLEDSEEEVGPECFDVIQLLGKGSFGEVYLVRYKPTRKPYAMKVLNKRRIMAQNLVKYAKTERNVLCFTKHPFIVGIDFAFQTSDKLFLILEYCPG